MNGLIIQNVSVGNHKVSAGYKNFKTQLYLVDVAAGNVSTVQVAEFELAKGKLTIQSLPIEAVIYVDGNKNIKSSDEFDLVKDEEAINDSDIIVFLVAHDEFKGIRIFGIEVFDFCGVTNHN